MADTYDSSDIKIMKGLDAVRKRPGMYVGDTEDGTGLLQLIWEVFSNSLDQFLAHKCTTISVIIHADNMVEIIDDGEGIRVDKIDGIPLIEIVMTELHNTANYDGHAPHTHVGCIRGVGIAVVNGLSSKIEINSYRDGYRWSQQYSCGEPSKLIKHEATEKTGTSFKLLPDESVFSNLDYDERAIQTRLKELACLNPGLKIQFEDHRTIKKGFNSDNGIADFLSDIQNDFSDLSSPVISGSGESQGISVDVAFCWHQHGSRFKSFANQLCTVDGGAHVKGVIGGIALGLKRACKGKLRVNGFYPVVENDLRAVVNVNIADPRFAGPTKDRLINPTAEKAVKKVASDVAYEFLVNDETVLKRLVNNYVSHQVHKLWRKLYKEDRKAPNVGQVKGLADELFDLEIDSAHLVSKFEERMEYFDGFDPISVSRSFLVNE